MEERQWNPRFALWALAHGYRPEHFDRLEDGESVRIPDPDEPGKLRAWPGLYSRWITACWRTWAEGLGFKARDGYSAHEIALRSRRTHEQFDAWLVDHVEELLRSRAS